MSGTLPVSHPPTSVPGTPTALASHWGALAAAVTGGQLCALGWHAWVPWLNTGGSWLTWCARQGCDHSEQYDIEVAK